jgi:predicted permease
MRALKRLFTRLQNFVIGLRGDDRLREEMEQHLAFQTDENVRAGMLPEEARRQAILKLGPVQVIREHYHSQETLPILENLVRDFRYAVRRLLNSPSFAITAILTMAFGIGATSLVFSIFYAVVVDPYPYRDAEHIVQIGFVGKQGLRGFMAVNTVDFETVRHASTVADAMQTDFSDPITTVAGYPEDIEIARLSGNAFKFLGVSPLFGRTLTAADEDQHFVVLGYRFCRSHFQCDPTVLGRSVDLDHQQFSVVGVMPPRFAWEEAAAFVPLSRDANPEEAHPLFLRPRKGVSAIELSTQMLTLVRGFVLTNEGVELPAEIHLVTMPFGQLRGDLTQKRIVLLFAAVCILLVIACTNVSILLIGRTSARHQEFQIRHALGASRRRIAHQVLAEAVLTSCCGGLLGVGLAYIGVAVLRSSLDKSFLPAEAFLSVNVWVLAFSTLVSVGTGLLFGLMPGLQAAKSLFAPRLTSQFVSRSIGNRRSQRTLIGSQVALALVLLAIAGASVRSFIALYKMDMGYNPHRVLEFRLPLSTGQNASWTARVQYRTRLREALRHISGVMDASIDEAMPTGGGMQMEYGLPADRYGADMDARMPRADFEFVDSHYLSLLDIPVRSGRGLSQADQEAAEPVALINQTFARHLFGVESPLGHFLRVPPLVAGYEDFARPPHPTQMVRIIGVTGDVRAAWLPGAPPRETIYLSESLFATSHSLLVHLRTSGDPYTVLETARHVINQVNPAQPISNPRTLDEILSQDLRSRDRWLAVLTGIFSSSALFLAAIGLYSVVLFAVGKRSQEFGLRIALGAARSEILRVALFSELKVVLFGIGAGALLVLFLQKFMASVMELAPINLWFLFPACAVMLVVSAFAAYLPARGAASVDPMHALRSE